MLYFKVAITLLNILLPSNCNIHDNRTEDVINLVTSYDVNYNGEKFPIKYLVPDTATPTIADVEKYLFYIQRVLKYFHNHPNETDSSGALCLFLTKAILKRTLLDDGDKLQSSHLDSISKMIHKSDYVLSHYIYKFIHLTDWTHAGYKFARLLQNDEILAYNIDKFNYNNIEPWVFTDEYMNDLMEEIDEGTLPKEKYVGFLFESTKTYSITMDDSDRCITDVAYNVEPLNLTSMLRPCVRDDFCENAIFSPPSVAYALSHRMLNILVRQKIRNCYIKSEEDDLNEIDKLCAFMYRETVYLARRGYFVRDMFLEHVTLCAIMGYVEFYRLHWFNKALTWVNEYDCIKEHYNFEYYRKLSVGDVGSNFEEKSNFIEWRCATKNALCHNHPTGLLLTTLSHGVRYATHFMQPS